MQAMMEFVPAILATGVAYVLMLAGMWKHDIKKVYSRRVRKEKLLTAGILAFAVLVMLLLVSHQTVTLMAEGIFSKQMYEGLSLLFENNGAIIGMIVYLIGGLPALVLGACVLDELSEKYTQLSLPFYFYIVLFHVERLFWCPMELSIVTWLMILLVANIFYGLAKWYGKGVTKQSKLVMLFSAVVLVVVAILDKSMVWMNLIRYIVLIVFNIGIAWILNRATVLKKKIWYAVVIVCYGIILACGVL